jgi:hypothetical protein
MNANFIFGMKTNCSKDCGFSDLVRTTERGYIVHENQVKKLEQRWPFSKNKVLKAQICPTAINF